MKALQLTIAGTMRLRQSMKVKNTGRSRDIVTRGRRPKASLWRRRSFWERRRVFSADRVRPSPGPKVACTLTVILFTSLSFELLQHRSLGKTDKGKRKTRNLGQKIIMRNMGRSFRVGLLESSFVQWLVKNSQGVFGRITTKILSDSIPTEAEVPFAIRRNCFIGLGVSMRSCVRVEALIAASLGRQV
jgi:hypothetical protein